MSLESIRSLAQTDLDATDHFIRTELTSDIPLINQLVEYILQCGGKRIRPLLVLLSAHTFLHEQQQHIDIAAAIELIHTATLLHDDVVDNSSLRRGHQTAHTIWGNEASVLVGDFLYSRAFQLIVRTQNLAVINIFSDATNLIAEGEVMQLINCHDPNTSELSYFQVIERKTAKLFEVATQAGTALATDRQEYIMAMKQYGLDLGIAYQLIDDVLDYSASTEQLGKTIGNDLTEGKPTLPLIYALRKGSHNEIDLIRKAITTGSITYIDDILEIIESTGAIEYTASTAKKYAQNAMNRLAIIPESPYSKALHTLAEFTVERNY
jgi:octaprenyl-diphosphate synthase